MFEHRKHPLIARAHFIRRLIRHFLIAVGIIFLALFLGALGYHYTESLPWLDAFLNASMILAGMGPVNELRTEAGKLFATLYALFSGVAFITIVGVLFAPIFHRFLHKFHLEMEDDSGNKNK
jgi:hypothetical protein